MNRIEKDLEYEALNVIPNTNKYKCRNYKFCRMEGYDFDNYLCHVCCYTTRDTCVELHQVFYDSSGNEYAHLVGPHGWGILDIIEEEEEPCAICFESNKEKIKFPTNCGHKFCVECTRNILLWDYSMKKISPEEYGCPPCPNGCVNPKIGKQCECKEYVRWQGSRGASEDKIGVIEKWRRTNEEKYLEWMTEENNTIINDLISEDNSRGTMKCPMCRSKYISKANCVQEDIENQVGIIPDRYYQYTPSEEINYQY